MKLGEAIEELGSLGLPIKTEQDHNKHLAVRLGIEALRMVLRQRDIDTYTCNTTLPGETED